MSWYVLQCRVGQEREIIASEEKVSLNRLLSDRKMYKRRRAGL